MQQEMQDFISTCNLLAYLFSVFNMMQPSYLFVLFASVCVCVFTMYYWPHPVELGPGYSHVAVVLGVIAAACKSLLCQEDQVIF